MLKVANDKPEVISAPVLLLAIIKAQSDPLILQRGGTKFIVEHYKGVLGKIIASGFGGAAVGIYIVTGSGLILYAIPLILSIVIYAESHIDCRSFVQKVSSIDTTESRVIEYIDVPANVGPIIVIPDTGIDKILYLAFDENNVPANYNLRCFARDHCLGSEIIERKSNYKSNLKPKKFVPLR